MFKSHCRTPVFGSPLAFARVSGESLHSVPSSLGDGWLSTPEVEQMLEEALANSNGEAQGGGVEGLPSWQFVNVFGNPSWPLYPFQDFERCFFWDHILKESS